MRGTNHEQRQRRRYRYRYHHSFYVAVIAASILLLGDHRWSRCGCWAVVAVAHGALLCDAAADADADAVVVTAADYDDDGKFEDTEQSATTASHVRRSAATDSNIDDNNNNSGNNNYNDDDDPTCGMYMAQSSIPNAGWGMFTAKYIPQFAPVMANDMALPVEDIEENLLFRRRYLKSKRQVDHHNISEEEPWWLPEDYFWRSRSTLSHNEAEYVQTLLPGTGMLANCHLGLINAVVRGAQKYQDLHRGLDPGAGASTLYHDALFLAINGSIPAGSEIFISYGRGWFEHRIKELGVLPWSEDYAKADGILEEFWRIIMEGNLETDVARGMYQLLLQAVEGQERLAKAFPPTLEEVPLALARGGTAAYSIPGDGHVKTVDWLQQHGWCIDHLKPGKSTLPQAGRGAFATRNLTAGTIVAPLPVVHFPRAFMEIYERNLEYSTVYRERTQIMYNYCYGHNASSILFFPYSPIVNYINHNATLVNVKLQWSSHELHKSEWFQNDPQVLAKEPHAGLVMELIATRDIAEGDEIFLDYGPEWEQAWNDYVINQTWKSSAQDKLYVSAAQWNNLAEAIRTEEEQRSRPYPDNVFIHCFTDSFQKNETNPELQQAPESPESVYEWKDADGLYIDATRLYPCSILRRYPEQGQVWYDVRIEGVLPNSHEKPVQVLVRHVPRHAIRFEDRPYTSDHALRTAFRHEIGLPDEMLPAAWRDL